MFKRERESSSDEGTLLLKKVSARFPIIMCEVDLITSTQATLIETSTVHVTTSKIEWKKFHVYVTSSGITTVSIT